MTRIPLTLLLLLVGCGALRPDPESLPDPRWSPADVVRIQIDALRKNDEPERDAGIEIAFRFASPANKRVTGPLERFEELVHNPVYRPMLGHEVATYEQVEVVEDEAAVVVSIVGRDGRVAAFLFQLSRQRGGDYDGCWMTDSVIRLDEPEDEPGLAI